jgi:phage terminase small subunit
MDEKQRRFVREYLKHHNAAEAGRRVGLAGASGKRQAARLLHQPEIAKAVRRGIAAQRRRRLVSADRVLEEFARIAFADIRDYASWDGNGVTLRSRDEISDAAAAAIAEISHAGKTPRIKLHDKKAALAALARHLGLFEPRAETADPKALHAEAARLRDVLLERVAALAEEPDTHANGDDQ